MQITFESLIIGMPMELCLPNGISATKRIHLGSTNFLFWKRLGNTYYTPLLFNSLAKVNSNLSPNLNASQMKHANAEEI